MSHSRSTGAPLRPSTNSSPSASLRSARLAFLLTGSSAVADEIAQDACEEVLRRWADVSFPAAYTVSRS